MEDQKPERKCTMCNDSYIHPICSICQNELDWKEWNDMSIEKYYTRDFVLSRLNRLFFYFCEKTNITIEVLSESKSEIFLQLAKERTKPEIINMFLGMYEFPPCILKAQYMDELYKKGNIDFDVMSSFTFDLFNSQI
jgi:hypothetical protein